MEEENQDCTNELRSTESLRKSPELVRKYMEHPIKKDLLQILTHTKDLLQILTRTMEHPMKKDPIQINESENLSENVKKSQSKKSKQTPMFLNEYYAPAIEFQAFDPRPPELRGISNAQKKIIDEMFEKKFKRKLKQKI